MFVNPNKMWIVYMSIFLYFNTSIAQHVYTSIRIYVYTAIHATPVVFFYIYFYLSFHFRFWFRPHFPSACSHLRLLFCKGIAGWEHGKHRNKSYWRKTYKKVKNRDAQNKIFNHKQLKLTYRHDGEIK